MEPIEWDRSFEDSRGARLFAYVFLGSFFGLGLLIAISLVVALPLLVGSLLDEPAMLAVVALFALVGGPMSLLYLWPLLTDPEQRQGIWVSSWPAALSRTGAIAAAILGAAAHVITAWVTGMGPALLLAVGGLVGSLGMSLFLSSGRIDPNARTLTIRPNHWAERSATRTVDLDGWTNLRQYRIGPVVVLWPSYASGSSGPRPRLLTVPPRVADAAAPVFEAAIDVPAPERERATNPTVGAVLVVFGLGTFAVGAALWTLDAVPAAFRAWFAAFAGVFGFLFLAAAWRER
ncbi:hypothetical protein SAMN05216559_1622 [Halomicrobium zhouii]|uniref:Uncharacterized protein n=2 Tax=Halomicrobium zhouii TaxID=767519 RepID=A0A1I6KZ60_9EURY|nr:hypothetical protein SAMN05216559_1622 [Halomicrobium zhouii]